MFEIPSFKHLLHLFLFYFFDRPPYCFVIRYTSDFNILKEVGVSSTNSFPGVVSDEVALTLVEGSYKHIAPLFKRILKQTQNTPFHSYAILLLLIQFESKINTTLLHKNYLPHLFQLDVELLFWFKEDGVEILEYLDHEVGIDDIVPCVEAKLLNIYVVLETEKLLVTIVEVMK